MLKTQIYSDFASVKDSWRIIQKELPLFYPFLTWEWQNTWWQIGGKTGLYNVVVNEEDKPIGLGSFRIENGGIYWSSNEEISDYLDIISGPQNYEAVWREILPALKTLNPKRLILRNVPQASAALKVLEKLALAENLSFKAEVEDVVPNIILPKNFENYLELLSRKDRHELRRKWRRFVNETGGNWRLIKSEPDNLPKDCARFFKLFREDGEGKRQFLTPEMEEFFCRETAEMAKLGLLDFSTLKIGAETAAQTIAFKDKNRYFLFNMATGKNFLHLSPGLMINKLLIEESIRDGLEVYDFMQGNEHYKYQLGAKDEYVKKVTMNF